MTSRRTLLKSATALVALSLAAPVFARSDAPIPVVATFSILGDMVAEIGGDHIALTTLVGLDGDAHTYQPTPADARAVSNAEILFVNGLAFEGWMDRLLEASDFDGAKVITTTGITPLPADEEEDHDEDEAGHEGHHHVAFNPHAWQSAANAVVYVNNITAALAQTDPENATSYYRNRAKYVDELEALDAEIHAAINALPANRRTIVTTHDAFGYYGEEYGLSFLAPEGLSTESEASAGDLAALISQIRDQSIGAVFFENISDNRLMAQIAEETDATIGGTVFSDALSGPEGPAATYLDMMHHNLAMFSQALNH